VGAFLVGPIRQGSVPRPLEKPGATLAVARSNWFASSERELHLGRSSSGLDGGWITFQSHVGENPHADGAI
jgi:hypothetical protein